MTDKILVLGKDGQLGRALTKLLGSKALAVGRAEADFLDTKFISKLETWASAQEFSAVINAAAYTAVDKAQAEGREDAFRINAAAVGELGAWCKKRGVPLVHYSTDYIFDGSGDRPWKENDKPSPINAYGESKLAGEKALKEVGAQYVIFRASWVYDAQGKNFFNAILRLLREKESLDVVADQIGAPTYAPHLAKTTLMALPKLPSGGNIFHLCGSGETSWHGFAQAIFALARTRDSGIRCGRINPIPTSAYPLPARRPLNSRLDCALARERLGLAMPHWEEGVKECIDEAYGNTGRQTGGTQNHPARSVEG